MPSLTHTLHCCHRPCTCPLPSSIWHSRWDQAPRYGDCTHPSLLFVAPTVSSGVTPSSFPPFLLSSLQPTLQDRCFNPTRNMKNLANYSRLHWFASSYQLLQDTLQIPKCSHVLVLFGFCGEQKVPWRLALFWVLPFLGGDGGWAGLSNRCGI